MQEENAKPLHIGRPRSEAAASHAAIMDAVYELLKVKPARDLTIDAISGIPFILSISFNSRRIASRIEPSLRKGPIGHVAFNIQII